MTASHNSREEDASVPDLATPARSSLRMCRRGTPIKEVGGAVPTAFPGETDLAPQVGASEKGTHPPLHPRDRSSAGTETTRTLLFAPHPHVPPSSATCSVPMASYYDSDPQPGGVFTDGTDSGISPGNLENSIESSSSESPDMSYYRFARNSCESLPPSECIYPMHIHTAPSKLCDTITDASTYVTSSLVKLSDRGSPSHDLGYHTLVTSSSTSHSRSHLTPKRCTGYPETLDMNILSSCPNDGPRPRPPEIPQRLPNRTIKKSFFDKLPDKLLHSIFSYLTADQLCVCACVSRRWRDLVWDPRMWTTIKLTGQNLNADWALKSLTRALTTKNATRLCLGVEKVVLNGCSRLSDTGLSFIAKKCSKLRQLELRNCVKITNKGVAEIISECKQLQHLDIAGCIEVNSLFTRNSYLKNEVAVLQQLHYLDLTDCRRIEDNTLKELVRFSTHLQYLYLRRCVNITGNGSSIARAPDITYFSDVALQYLCLLNELKELSVSDCPRITDYGLYHLASVGGSLRYLSVAKCDRVSDSGVIYLIQHCTKLRYLNVRGCEAVSDRTVEALSQKCCRIRALDLGKCDITDCGLDALAKGCLNLKRLSVRGCEQISENGLRQVALCCRGLQQLSLQECTSVTPSGYRSLRQICRRCVIEHNNPAFL